MSPDRHARTMLPIPVGKDDHDHFIDPEERLRTAMSQQ
jgi:hypothetical protein